MVNKKKHRTVKITGIHTIKVPYEHKFIVDDDLDVNEFDWDKFIDGNMHNLHNTDSYYGHEIENGVKLLNVKETKGVMEEDIVKSTNRSIYQTAKTLTVNRVSKDGTLVGKTYTRDNIEDEWEHSLTEEKWEEYPVFLEYDGGIPEGELLGNPKNSNNSQFD